MSETPRSMMSDMPPAALIASVGLALLGSLARDAGDLDETELRRAFRARSRLLHPDLNPNGEGVDASDFEGGVAPTIYELNQAFETVKKVLDA